MTKEALTLALEALDDLSRYADLCELLLKETHPAKAFALRERVTNSIKTITAIKEALAQPEQDGNVCARCGGIVFDPVVAQPEQEPTGMLHIDRLDKWLDASLKERKQRTWVGLTDETLDDVYFCVEGSATPLETWREQARTIEAKLKEKNT